MTPATNWQQLSLTSAVASFPRPRSKKSCDTVPLSQSIDTINRRAIPIYRYLVIVKRDLLNLLRSLVKVLVNLEINYFYLSIFLPKFCLKIVVTYNDVHYRRSIQMDVSYQGSHPTSVIPSPDQTGAQATSLVVFRRCWVPFDRLCVSQHMAKCCIWIDSPWKKFKPSHVTVPLTLRSSSVIFFMSLSS